MSRYETPTSASQIGIATGSDEGYAMQADVAAVLGPQFPAGVIPLAALVGGGTPTASDVAAAIAAMTPLQQNAAFDALAAQAGADVLAPSAIDWAALSAADEAALGAVLADDVAGSIASTDAGNALTTGGDGGLFVPVATAPTAAELVAGVSAMTAAQQAALWADIVDDAAADSIDPDAINWAALSAADVNSLLGSLLPANAAGALINDGSGVLSWVAAPAPTSAQVAAAVAGATAAEQDGMAAALADDMLSTDAGNSAAVGTDGLIFVPAAPSGNTYTNGLTLTGTDVDLGGALEQATTIDKDGNPMIIGGDGALSLVSADDEVLLDAVTHRLAVGGADVFTVVDGGGFARGDLLQGYATDTGGFFWGYSGEGNKFIRSQGNAGPSDEIGVNMFPATGRMAVGFTDLNGGDIQTGLFIDDNNARTWIYGNGEVAFQFANTGQTYYANGLGGGFTWFQNSNQYSFANDGLQKQMQVQSDGTGVYLRPDAALAGGQVTLRAAGSVAVANFNGSGLDSRITSLITDTTAVAANVVANGAGRLQRSTSAAKYKTDIRPLDVDREALLALADKAIVYKDFKLETPRGQAEEIANGNIADAKELMASFVDPDAPVRDEFADAPVRDKENETGAEFNARVAEFEAAVASAEAEFNARVAEFEATVAGNAVNRAIWQDRLEAAEAALAAAGKLSDEPMDYVGLLAEDVAEFDERLVNRGLDGDLEGVMYERFTAVLLVALGEGSRELAALTDRVAELEGSDLSETNADKAFRAFIGSFSISGSYPDKQNAMSSAVNALGADAPVQDLFDAAVDAL